MAKSTSTTPVLTVESLVAEHAATVGAKRRTLRDTWMQQGMESALAGDMVTAAIFAEAVGIAKSQSGPTASSATVIDWRQVTSNRIDALRRAADAIESGEVRPAGTPDDVDLTELPEPDESTRSESIAIAGTRLAGKRAVPEFIAERVAALGAGMHTPSQLAAGQVDAPGTGAIGAVWAKMSDERAFQVPGVIAGRNEAGTQAFGPDVAPAE